VEPDVAAMAKHERVLAALAGDAGMVNARFAHVEQVKRFAILDRDLTHETGELTPTQKRSGPSPTGNILDPDRDRQRQPKIRSTGGERDPDRQSFGQVVDGQRREQQGRAVAGGEFLGCRPTPLAKSRVCVGDEQVEGCDESGAEREAEQRVEGERARAPKDEHGHPTEPGGPGTRRTVSSA
jgi:hypothetical protein